MSDRLFTVTVTLKGSGKEYEYPDITEAKVLMLGEALRAETSWLTVGTSNWAASCVECVDIIPQTEETPI
jgi:hypothetical protein